MRSTSKKIIHKHYNTCFKIYKNHNLIFTDVIQIQDGKLDLLHTSSPLWRIRILDGSGTVRRGLSDALDKALTKKQPNAK